MFVGILELFGTATIKQNLDFANPHETARRLVVFLVVYVSKLDIYLEVFH